jgi:DNA adenine methylase
VLVNQQTKRIEDLYRSLGFDIGYLDAPRRISCNGDRTPAKEIVATRNIERRAIAATGAGCNASGSDLRERVAP